MEQVLEVIYRNGAFLPLKPLGLPENQRLKITLHLPAEKRAADTLASWQQVYAGLSDTDVTDVEAIARDREHFMPERG
jgi:predicted DNA-binding antitoxin AbrB/MazE fold protein